MNRKRFLRALGIGGLASSALSACYRPDHNRPPTTTSSERASSTLYHWKMVTTWPPKFPILGELCESFAHWVFDMSQGRIKIDVFGGGELVPALEVFDTVRNGAAQIGHSSPYYWAGKIPAAQLFSAVPFGMNALQQSAWINEGGGMQLYRDLYAPFDIIPFLAGNTNAQMGGWFNKKIDKMSDLKGLKMRIPGLGGKILSRAGGTPVLSPGGEIYTNLERGVIDAAEWIGPYHDYLMGFHEIAKYYYAPGWQEMGATLEMIFHKPSLESLPEDLRQILTCATYRLHQSISDQMEVMNTRYLELMKAEGVNIQHFPLEVLRELNSISTEVLEKMTAQDEQMKRVYDAMNRYRNRSNDLYSMTESPLRNL